MLYYTMENLRGSTILVVKIVELFAARACIDSVAIYVSVRLWVWVCPFFSQPSIYIDGWLYGMRMTSVVCNVPVLSQNDSTYHHSVFTT